MQLPPRGRFRIPGVVLAAVFALVALPAFAAAPQPGPPLTIQRASGAIAIDGVLSDAGWKGVTPVTTWFETRVGENAEPQVKNVGFLAYDDKYLYAAFEFEDPNPSLIRAPIADHDQLSGNTDYGGILVDSNNDSKSAVMFLANPNGLKYDAITNDASGEDNSPDYYWESAGKVTATGWTLEIRVPFSSLRYSRDPSPTWGVMLYRNYPRDRHYQFFTAKLPRDVSCFICNESKLTGLADLPHGSHLVLAPYSTGQRIDKPQAGPGSPLAAGDVDSEFGADVKWSPLASLALDATINPDFSQVEADVPQIGANERFALSFPEKRSFFLEGIDLFATPLQAVYTRSITSPSGGVRATGRAGGTSFTALAARDRGRGIVILPGPEGSGDAPQDFESDVGVLRLRRDFGQSFAGVLGTARMIEGGGDNFVFGPDLQWRPRPGDAITAQALWSATRTPLRTDLAPEWDGRRLDDRALLLRGSHNTRSVDVFVQGQDLGGEFRADDGFIPQVGYREIYFESGYTVRPKKGFLSRLRLFTIDWYDEKPDGEVLARRTSVGAGMDGRLSSFLRIELNRDDFRVGDRMFQRFQPRINASASPGRLLNSVDVDVRFGEEIDFANARKGDGTTISGGFTLHPGDHLNLSGRASARQVHVDDPVLGSGRLFLDQFQRLRGTWSFSSRTFLRLIGTHTQITRDARLYTSSVTEKRSGWNLSALWAYKVNWQTVLYLGYGDDREFHPADDRFVRAGRQAFAKLSYAVQQ